MLLSEYLNIHKLSNHCREGYVQARNHKSLPLVIYTYTRKTVFENAWDDVTEKCRGLIVDTHNGEIIARPFEKFFNIDTFGKPETSSRFLAKGSLGLPKVTEKYDGNLGILYTAYGTQAIASKGSFHSEHAEWATKWYREHSLTSVWPAGHTAVFECICEEIQHHVVHYGGNDRLVLLALINNETGEELDQCALAHWGQANNIEVAKVYVCKTVAEVLEENRPNAEGYVLSWHLPRQTPFRVKVKHQDFLRLQKLRNGITRKNVFLALAEENTALLLQWVTTEDKHLNNRVQKVIDEYMSEYHRVFGEVSALVQHGLKTCTTRREFAALFTQEENRGLSAAAFSMIDQADYRPAIWKVVGKRLKEKELPGADKVDSEDYDG